MAKIRNKNSLVGKANVPIKAKRSGQYTNYKGSLYIDEKTIREAGGSLSISMEVNEVKSGMSDKFGNDIVYFVRVAIFEAKGGRR